MNTLYQNLAHMIMATVAIAAVTILALQGTISGGEALGVIGAASGFTMAAGAGSASGSAAVAITPSTSVSPGQTVTETVAHTLSAVPATPTER